MSNDPDQKRPYKLLRAALAVWLLCWVVIIILFIKNQFSNQPLFSWPFGFIWIGASVLGWVLIYRAIKRLREIPPE